MNFIASGSARSVLAISSELPWPLNTGGHLRSFHLLTGLAKTYRVRLVTGISGDQREGLDVLARRGVHVVPVMLPPRRVHAEIARAVGAALRREPYVLYRRHDRREMRSAVRHALQVERPDVVYLDHLDSAVFADLAPSGTVVADLHNVYSLIACRSAQEHPSVFGRAFLRREAGLLARMEQRLVTRARAVLAVSREECDYYGGLGAGAVQLVPNGVACADYASLPTGRQGAAPLILYIGTMSWSPNAAAARFLANEVLPAIRHRIPAARLRIVGKNPPPDLQCLDGHQGVEVTGSVPDVLPHLRDAALLAVPLETGGGTRLKILEAFAAGLPVVSTPIGAEGIDCEPGHHLIVTDRTRFASDTVSMLSDVSVGLRLAKAAREMVALTYDWSVVVSSAVAAIESRTTGLASIEPATSSSVALSR